MNILHLELPIVGRLEYSTSESPKTNILHAPEENIRDIAASGRGAIERRLREIEDEWAIDDIFEKSAAVISAGTFVMGMVVDELWFAVPLLIAVLLFQQTIQGWCPVVALLRGLGFRSEREIQFERHALEQIEEEQDGCRCSQMAMAAGAAVSDPPAPCPACAASFSLREFLHGPKQA
jgi:hypothetical protein